METKWGTKDILIIESILKDEAGNELHVTDYRDADLCVRYKAELTCN